MNHRKSLLNRRAVRAWTKDLAARTHRPFTQVSNTWLDGIERDLETLLATRIHSHRTAKRLRDVKPQTILL